MGNVILETPVRRAFVPCEPAGEPDLLALEADLRHPPDWERLIEAGTTPALFVGAERRLRRTR